MAGPPSSQNLFAICFWVVIRHEFEKSCMYGEERPNTKTKCPVVDKRLKYAIDKYPQLDDQAQGAY